MKHPPTPSHRRPERRNFAALVLALAIPVLAFGCERPEPTSAPVADSKRQLLIAYEILGDTLADESKLGALLLLKRVTFNRPVPEIEEIMKRVGSASKQRAGELEKLRELPPDVSGAPTEVDAIGEAITRLATEAGTDEMLGNETFGVRFVLLQAQATRMVAAIAGAAAEFEDNSERKAWLTEVAKQFEGLREELIDIVEKYLMQKGEAQQD